MEGIYEQCTTPPPKYDVRPKEVEQEPEDNAATIPMAEQRIKNSEIVGCTPCDKVGKSMQPIKLTKNFCNKVDQCNICVIPLNKFSLVQERHLSDDTEEDSDFEKKLLSTVRGYFEVDPFLNAFDVRAMLRKTFDYCDPDKLPNLKKSWIMVEKIMDEITEEVTATAQNRLMTCKINEGRRAFFKGGHLPSIEELDTNLYFTKTVKEFGTTKEKYIVWLWNSVLKLKSDSQKERKTSELCDDAPLSGIIDTDKVMESQVPMSDVQDLVKNVSGNVTDQSKTDSSFSNDGYKLGIFEQNWVFVPIVTEAVRPRSVSPLKDVIFAQIHETDVTIDNRKLDIEMFIDWLEQCTQLKFLTLKNIQIQHGDILLQAWEFIDSLSQLVQYSPIGEKLFELLFNAKHQQIIFIEDQLNMGTFFKIVPEKGLLTSSLPRIENILRLIGQKSSIFNLNKLHLSRTMIHNIDGLESIFENLQILSLQDVAFMTSGGISGKIPNRIMKLCKKLTVLRYELNNPWCVNLEEKKFQWPTRMKNLVVSGNILLPNCSYKNVETVYVDFPLLAKARRTPDRCNVAQYCVTSAQTLFYVIASDAKGKRKKLRTIWVNGYASSLKHNQNWWEWIMPELIKQMRIPSDQEDFLLERNSAEKPWDVKYPSTEEKNELRKRFFVEI